MKHRTITREAEKAGLKITSSESMQRTFYRISRDSSNSLMWATHKSDPENAECVTIEGDGYSHNARYAKVVRSFLNA